jgi:disulfide bond formation protein DsbB
LLPRQLLDILYAPRRVFVLMFLVCLGLLAYALYLQHGVGLEPCPMCIVQRYALILIAIWAGGAALFKSRPGHGVGALLVLLSSAFGAFVAARQSWLQWHPPEFLSCGRDFYGMIEAFPLQRVVPMIFRGSGDCAAIDWTFLGLTIANWSFVCFVLMAFGALWSLQLLLRRAQPQH